MSVDHESVDPEQDVAVMDTTLSPNFSAFARHADDGAELTYNLVCWGCGWSQVRTLVLRDE